MKKLSKFFMMLIAVALSTTVVYADSTMNKDNNIEEYTNASKSTNTFDFDDKDDGTYLNVTVNITEDFKNEVLAHVPGKGNSEPTNASIGKVYYGLKTGFCSACSKVETALVRHTDDSITDAKNSLSDYSEDADKGNYYLTLVEVQYMLENGDWVTIAEEADGNTSIGQKLVEILGLSNTSELVYGENYRFFVDTTQSILIGFKVDGGDAKYVNISYDVAFPVYAVDDKGHAVYYEDLQDALNASDTAEVHVTEEYIANDTITVPDGVKLVVNEGGSIVIPEGKDFIVKGEFVQEYGTAITIGGKEVYEIVYYAPDGNGKVTANKKAAVAGDTITFDYLPNKGYKLKKLSVKGEINGKWTDLELLKDGKSFVMPESDVEIYATFEKDTAIPPKTGDINLIIIGSMILAAIGGTIFASRKIAAKVK